VAWLSFDQSSQPFSQQTKAYVEQIDIVNDLRMLSERLPLRSVCLKNMRISGTLLKVGARMDLTLQQIGFILCRPDDDEEQLSILETLVH
jgi:hypothetical protein